MQTLLQDMRYGFRVLLKKPGFTLIAVITLALGIGANTAIFSFVDQLLVQTLLVQEPERLVNVSNRGPLGDKIVTNTSFSYPLFADYRDQNEVLDGLAAYSSIALSLSEAGQSERIN